MNILAHRGMWSTIEEKNTIEALKKAIDKGYGIETDVRDYKGSLVISHDIASENAIGLDQLFQICENKELWIALNVKADGLGSLAHKTLKENRINNYFFFDMSVPEMYFYIKRGYKVFTRQSEFEESPMFYSESIGVWIDEFEEEWILGKHIYEHIKQNKYVALVSPELHGRNKESRWDLYKSVYKKLDCIEKKMLFLCTDYPEEARLFFNETDKSMYL